MSSQRSTEMGHLAQGPTFVLRVELLFPVFGSNVAALTETVLLTSTLPGVVTFTTKVSDCVVFTASLASVQLITPFELAGGALHVHGPGVMLTNLLPFGIASVSSNCFPMYLPRFFTVTEYLS